MHIYFFNGKIKQGDKMLNKTTSISFIKYGEVFNDNITDRNNINENTLLKVNSNTINFMYEANEDIYFKEGDGIVLLIVTDNLNNNNFDEFIVHKVVKLNKGTFFNFIPLTDTGTIELSSLPNTNKLIHNLDKPYTHKKIKPSIIINEIIAYYYSVRNVNYFFPAEQHDYWELTFVDSGTFVTNIDGKEYVLNDNDIILYSPNTFHSQATGKNKNCSYLTIIFSMDITNTHIESEKIFHIDRDTRSIIEKFVNISQNAKNNDEIYINLMIIYLQNIITNLLKFKNDDIKNIPVAKTPMQQKFESELMNEIIFYINENIYSPLTIEELCNEFSISRSTLQILFKNNVGEAPKQYISNLKLNKSKQLIKESKYTISEISDILGFTSIHYFSRKFKQYFGVSPTEFAKRIYSQ